MNKFRDLHISHVDEQIKALKFNDLVSKPPIGWIKLIREAIGMSSKALAKKLNISTSTMSETERAEIDEAISLKKLRKVAEELNCDLVYYFLPRVEISKMIEDRAQHLAKKKLLQLKGHMDLEDQSVSEKFIEQKTRELINELKYNKKLWDEND